MSDLQEHRGAWIDEVCTAVLDRLGEFGDELKHSVRSDLGDEHLTAALLVAQVVSQVAAGQPRDQVVDTVFSSRVLTADAASQERIEELVDRAESVLASRGLPVAEPWDPRSGFTFLLEIWSAQQRWLAEDDEIVDQLRLHWGVTDSRAVGYLTSLRPDPLIGHRTVTERVEDDGRELVQAVVAKAFTDATVHASREQIMDAMDVSAIEHLRTLAVDITSIALMRDKIHAFGTMAHRAGKHEVAIAAAGARFLLEDARAATGELMEQLTNYEVGRLRLEADYHFQNACLESFLSRIRRTRLDEEVTASTGTFGPVPWWRAALSEDSLHGALACLDAGAVSVEMRHDEGADLLSLHLFDPRGEYFYTFAFFPSATADAFELLLLGRAERVGIDFETEGDDRRLRLGTLVPMLSDEVAEHLREVATAALRQHLGFEGGFESAASVRQAADVALLRPSAQSIWSRASWEFSRAVDVSDNLSRMVR